jgi:signal peptidase I
MTWDWSRAGASSTEQPRSRRRRGCRWWLDLGAYALAAALLGLAVWLLFTYRIGFVLTSSMSPTLRPGDQYLINLRAYRDRPPARGEIVVFTTREDPSPLVKRVIGLPGERVVILQGRVLINGTAIFEGYLGEELLWEPPRDITVPDGAIFVLGDNRNYSDDSRDFGPVAIRGIMGRAERIIRPASRRRSLLPPG